MVRILVGLSAAVFFAAYGAIALVWPNKLRDYHIRQAMRGIDYLKKFGIQYRWRQVFLPAFMYRLFGVMFLFASALTIVALLRG